jgi:hypothetical protein
MPACYLWKCDCGIEWKTFRIADHEIQTHVCVCKRKHEVRGLITHLFYSPIHELDINQVWNEVPRSMFRDHLGDVCQLNE